MNAADLRKIGQAAKLARYPTSVSVREAGLHIEMFGPACPRGTPNRQHTIDWLLFDLMIDPVGTVEGEIERAAGEIDALREAR